jgi:hypothetical protein
MHDVVLVYYRISQHCKRYQWDGRRFSRSSEPASRKAREGVSIILSSIQAVSGELVTLMSRVVVLDGSFVLYEPLSRRHLQGGGRTPRNISNEGNLMIYQVTKDQSKSRR